MAIKPADGVADFSTEQKDDQITLRTYSLNAKYLAEDRRNNCHRS